MMRLLWAILGLLIASNSFVFSAYASNSLRIQQLTEVSGRAEVVDKRQLNIYHRNGIFRVGLMWPAENHFMLRRQLATAVKVKCLLFGSQSSATCVAIDKFGSRWMLGKSNQLAFTR